MINCNANSRCSSRGKSSLEHDRGAREKRRGNFSRLWIERDATHHQGEPRSFRNSATRPFAPFFYAASPPPSRGEGNAVKRVRRKRSFRKCVTVFNLPSSERAYISSSSEGGRADRSHYKVRSPPLSVAEKFIARAHQLIVPRRRGILMNVP